MLSLVNLKQYIQKNKSCSLKQLSQFLQEEEIQIQMLIQHLIKKGLVCERRLTSKCGSQCQRCEFSVTVLYEWVAN